jgi:hypothetical protein
VLVKSGLDTRRLLTRDNPLNMEPVYIIINNSVRKVKFRIGALQHRSLKAYCALTPKEFLHSSLEALHTELYTAPQLAKEGTM